MPKPKDGKKRVVIEGVAPEIDAGRFAIKRIEGDTVPVEADVFADGHDRVMAWLLFRREDEQKWQQVKMLPLGNDRWRAAFTVGQPGRYLYTIAGSVDRFGTWRGDLEKRIAAGQEISVDLLNGASLVEHAATLARDSDAGTLKKWAEALKAKKTEAALDPGLAQLMEKYADPELESRYDREFGVTVDRERAGFSAWYEMFPRSASPQPGIHGTFKDCEARLGYIAELGFDVLYLPPIHPIGQSFRKGKNNSVKAEPGDVGSPWAIGSSEGGHTAIHPELGTLADLQSLIGKVKQIGMEVALDIAFQCSPDHPWVKEHPQWFKRRADGTIQYAENPPKKYQDIYPLDFESSDWEGLWDGLKGVFLYWAEQGIRIFRVDNPHTKAFPFWEWAIDEIKREYPDALFLAEAFTRPRVMQRLAKLGFSQSYTYFTWRNTKQELTEYLTELTTTGVKEYLRPNFWPNTPDILPEVLQTGGRPASASRVILAATLSSNYGIYGPAFELGENVPMKPGGEEYLNSEKYELKHWDLDAPGSLRGLLALLNRCRHENPALHRTGDLHFHQTDNPSLIAYSKRSDEGSNVVLTVVNIDFFNTQGGWVNLALDQLGVRDGETFQVHDQLTGNRYFWTGPRNYVELSPSKMPAHLFRVLKRVRSEKDFDYYQ
jgi:starch synthase (maltosyl-transferring)